jgi:Kef-type K+ transport system membrane component KefB
MRRIVVLALLFGAMKLIAPLGRPGDTPEALLTFGFLILAAYAAGELAARFGFPKLIGYLIAGLLSGPTVLGTVTATGGARLAPVSELAIALIAFLAGAELDLNELRRKGIALLRLTVIELVVAGAVLAVALTLMRPWLPFLAEAPGEATVLFIALFVLIAVMHSPAITMAILTESRAAGPASRTTLAVVLVSEVVIVVLFSVLLGVAQRLLPAAGAPMGGTAILIWEIGGSVPVGVGVGIVIAAALRIVKDDRMGFALLAALLGQQVAGLLHVEVLLTLLVAGFVAVNFAKEGDGDALRHAMEVAATPIFVVFFALAGVAIDVPAAVRMAPVVIPLALLRIGALAFGVRIGSWGLGLNDVQRGAVWRGLVSQAGVAIGLVAIVAEAYPVVGRSMQTMLLAFIAVNGMLGPILFRGALLAAGVVGSGDSTTAETSLPTPMPSVSA